MWGLVTPFTMTVAAQTVDGAEVKLQRQVQAVAIPVFQFGIFRKMIAPSSTVLSLISVAAFTQTAICGYRLMPALSTCLTG